MPIYKATYATSHFKAAENLACIANESEKLATISSTMQFKGAVRAGKQVFALIIDIVILVILLSSFNRLKISLPIF